MKKKTKKIAKNCKKLQKIAKKLQKMDKISAINLCKANIAIFL